MSGSTRLSRAERGWRALLPGAAALALAGLTSAFAALAASDPSADAPPLPPEVAVLAPGLHAQGGGEMTFFGLSIYHGWFWADHPQWAADRVYALDLHYQRNLDGALIAQRSVDEMEKIGRCTREQCQRWGEMMSRIFPNVRKGDRITGLHLATGAVRYFLNGNPIGEVADAGFAQAFFGIWLDPKTSRPEFRKKLLGESP
jgi:Chalcone isomerase-like